MWNIQVVCRRLKSPLVRRVMIRARMKATIEEVERVNKKSYM